MACHYKAGFIFNGMLPVTYQSLKQVDCVTDNAPALVGRVFPNLHVYKGMPHLFELVLVVY